MSVETACTLKLGKEISELSRMNDWITEVSDRLSLRDEVCHAVQLCLSELAANILLYGKPAAEGITIVIERLGNGIEVTVKDDGIPFDPVGFIPEPKPLSIEEAKIGGHGLRLVRKFTTAMRYDRTDNHNILKLTFAA